MLLKKKIDLIIFNNIFKIFSQLIQLTNLIILQHISLFSENFSNSIDWLLH